MAKRTIVRLGDLGNLRVSISSEGQASLRDWENKTYFLSFEMVGLAVPYLHCINFHRGTKTYSELLSLKKNVSRQSGFT